VQKELMERAGAPTLCLQGDAWLSGMTPMSALQEDIDQFVKNVVVKKRAPRSVRSKKNSR
jgi:hypothetical protein